MSVVLALKHNEEIFIASDSQVTKGGSRKTSSNLNNYKIWKVLNTENCLMGHVGAVRDANVIKTFENLVPEINVIKKSIDYNFIVNHLVPTLFNVLESRNLIEEASKNIKAMESEYIFTTEQSIFLICRDGAVIEIDDFVAIGSASSEALGSLISTVDMEPRERIVRAIKASATNDIYVDYPIIIGKINEQEFEVIYEKEMVIKTI